MAGIDLEKVLEEMLEMPDEELERLMNSIRKESHDAHSPDDGWSDYPMGTAKWDVTEEVRPGMQFYWVTCSKCGRKRSLFDYVDNAWLMQEYPFCNCGAKIVGVEERFEFE